MNGPPDDAGAALPIYGLIDSTSDGRRRIVAEFVSPKHACEGQRLLAWAGRPTELVLISAVREELGLDV